MEILGHDRISTTMNSYAHILPESLRAAATTMDALLREGADRDTDEEHEPESKDRDAGDENGKNG